MHIPDGYLSPATCAVMYAASAPFWYVALKRVKRALQHALVPLLSLVRGLLVRDHDVQPAAAGRHDGARRGGGSGRGVSWDRGRAMLAISIALVIQAFFFGDGGITAIGANCFNMAIVGSLIAWGIYRILAGRAAISSPRRVIAAGLAGYVAINLSALLCGHRVRNPADALSGRLGRAAVLPISPLRSRCRP